MSCTLWYPLDRVESPVTGSYSVAVQAQDVHNSAICVRPAACEYLNSIGRWGCNGGDDVGDERISSFTSERLEHYSLRMRFRVAVIGGLTVSDECGVSEWCKF
jgi:hypothetical protein